MNTLETIRPHLNTKSIPEIQDITGIKYQTIYSCIKRNNLQYLKYGGKKIKGDRSVKSKWQGIDLDKYKGLHIVDNPKVKSWFPPTKNPIYVVKESIYSITKHRDADKISRRIKKLFNPMVVTDATANVGGNTISFSKHFKKVNAVECNNTTCKALKNNIESYGLKNVTVYCDSYINLKLVQDVVFIDPPWGGPDYKKYKKLMLYLGDQPINKIIDNIDCNVALKCPRNFDFGSLSRKYKKDKYGGYYVLYIKAKGRHRPMTDNSVSDNLFNIL